jgi:hypothetical protein
MRGHEGTSDDQRLDRTLVRITDCLGSQRSLARAGRGCSTRDSPMGFWTLRSVSPTLAIGAKVLGSVSGLVFFDGAGVVGGVVAYWIRVYSCGGDERFLAECPEDSLER